MSLNIHWAPGGQCGSLSLLSISVEADIGPPINRMQVGSQPQDPGKGPWVLGVLPLAPDIAERREGAAVEPCLSLALLGTLLSFPVFCEMGRVPVCLLGNGATPGAGKDVAICGVHQGRERCSYLFQLRSLRERIQYSKGFAYPTSGKASVLGFS